MAHFKAMNNSYDNPQDLIHVIDYVLNPEKNEKKYYGALNVNLINNESIINEFITVKHVYGKEHGRQVRHFIISFSEDELVTPEMALNYAYQFAMYYSQYQIVFGVHTNEDNLHIHFAMNSVSFINGRMYSEGYGDWYSFVNYCKNILNVSDITQFE